MQTTNDSQLRLNEALFKDVKNAGTAGFGALETSQILLGKRQRYMDQLIEARLENIRSAYARERVSYEDPFAAMVTIGEALRECSKLPKFFDSDEIDSEEIGQLTRQTLEAAHWRFVAAAHKRLQKVHGWAVTLLSTDMAGRLQWHTWSELEIGPEDFIREWQLASFVAFIDPEILPLVVASLTGDRNRVVGWRLTGRAIHLPLNRSMGNVRPDRGFVWRAQPGVIYTTRGDEPTTKGYGLSRLESGWDSITKLRLESHADAFRSQIFAQVVHPPGWDDDQLDTLMDVLTHIDQTTALCLPAGKNADGTLVADLPSITFRTMAEDARQKSDKGSGGVFSNLSSEFVRFCGNYKIPISEVTGNPGGAIESADVDATKAVEEKINEYNLGRAFDVQFIETLRVMGAQIDLEPGAYVVKGWQEWEAHEKALAEQEQADKELDAKMQRGSQSFDDRANAYIKKFKRLNRRLAERDIEKLGWWAHAAFHQNAMPGVMAPITSSWVKSYGYDSDAFYLQFHGAGSTIFRYPYVDDPAGMAQGMESSGSPGGFVHDHPDLGVPRRTPYEKSGQLPGSMAWWAGSQALTEYTAMDERDEKVSKFGTARPARDPNLHNYPGQTRATTEQTTGPLRGYGQPDIAGISAALQQQPASFQGPDFASMQGTTPPPAGSMLPQQQPAVQQVWPPNRTRAPPGVGTSTGTGTIAPAGVAGASAPLGSQGSGQVGAPTTARTTVGQLPARVRPHAGKSRRGPPSTGMAPATSAAAPTSTLPSWQQYNQALEEDLLASAVFVPRVNASVVDLSVSEWQAASKAVNGGRGFSNETIEKVRKIVESHELVQRSNYRTHGNSMSFKDHPYVYRDNQGNLSVEYPCARDWKKAVVGKTGKLRINYANPVEHGDTIVGTITYGWDDANDCPSDVLDYDRDVVMAELERHNQQDSEVYKRLAAGMEPDVSTEYYCRNTVHKGRKWQVDFRVDPVTGRFDTCLVDHGNCPSGQCDFTPDVTAG